MNMGCLKRQNMQLETTITTVSATTNLQKTCVETKAFREDDDMGKANRKDDIGDCDSKFSLRRQYQHLIEWDCRVEHGSK